MADDYNELTADLDETELAAKPTGNGVFVAISNIKHGNGEVDAEGKPLFEYIENGEKVHQTDFPSIAVLRNLIAAGAVAEYKDVLVVEDSTKVNALTAENDDLKAQLAAMQAKLDAVNTPAS